MHYIAEREIKYLMMLVLGKVHFQFMLQSVVLEISKNGLMKSKQLCF